MAMYRMISKHPTGTGRKSKKDLLNTILFE
jgi:hypothetical protein